MNIKVFAILIAFVLVVCAALPVESESEEELDSTEELDSSKELDSSEEMSKIMKYIYLFFIFNHLQIAKDLWLLNYFDYRRFS